MSHVACHVVLASRHPIALPAEQGPQAIRPNGTRPSQQRLHDTTPGRVRQREEQRKLYCTTLGFRHLFRRRQRRCIDNAQEKQRSVPPPRGLQKTTTSRCCFGKYVSTPGDHKGSTNMTPHNWSCNSANSDFNVFCGCRTIQSCPVPRSAAAR